ncbi:MAG: Mor transcription activator family protein [Clostridiaceae bacterium]|nr:Mor transcription activator family protein [Clostridiaceae bacterium]
MYMKLKNDFNHLNNVYKEIAEEFGIDIAKRFYENFKGLQVNFPTRFLNKDYVIQQIKREYDGSNLKQLALKYDYSERWIRVMLSENSK